jgi:hypothetical protein
LKLLAKTNRIYLVFSLAIYLFAGLAFYQVVKILIYREVESRLRVERLDFEAYIQLHKSWSDSTYFIENKIDVVPVGHRPLLPETFIDTLIQNRYDHELMPFRQLTFYIHDSGSDEPGFDSQIADSILPADRGHYGHDGDLPGVAAALHVLVSGKIVGAALGSLLQKFVAAQALQSGERDTPGT